MDIQKEIRKIVRECIMEEINNLSVRAVLREKIEDAGFNHSCVREMIQETTDSYFRSAMNGDVKSFIKERLDRAINDAVNREIGTVINNSFSGWNGREKIKDALTKEVMRQVANGFDISISVKQIAVESEEA